MKRGILGPWGFRRKCGFFAIVFSFLCAAHVLHAVEIVYLEGKVEVKLKKEKEWKAASLGLKLQEGDTIRTVGMDSGADIDLDEKPRGKNVLRLGENTFIILRANMDPGQIDNIDLDSGDVLSKIKELNRDSVFEVYTLTAVAGARGTGWKVSTDKEEEESDISCLDGEIYVKAFDEQGRLLNEMDLGAGQKVSVKKGKPLAETASVADQDKQEWGGWQEEAEQEQPKDEPRTDNQKIEALYDKFRRAYSDGDINGVMSCVARDWESSSGQSLLDLDDRLNSIFSTFDGMSVEISGLSIQPSEDSEYVAKASYFINIEGSLASNPDIKHHDEGKVTDYIKEENGKYVIGKTVGSGGF